MSTNAIVVANLVKRYPGGVTAVDGVSFSVQGGQIFGFLGPNGAGKSTIIKILTTLALPSEGLATVGGYDDKQARARAAELIELVKLTDAVGRRVGT